MIITTKGTYKIKRTRTMSPTKPILSFSDQTIVNHVSDVHQKKQSQKTAKIAVLDGYVTIESTEASQRATYKSNPRRRQNPCNTVIGRWTRNH